MKSLNELCLVIPKRTLMLSFTACVYLACAGTETDNPANPTLEKFESSQCKKQPDGQGGQQPLILASSANGLQCFEWEQTGSDSVTLRLLNFDQGCVLSWKGAATYTDGKVDLALTNERCSVARCGSCLYDFTFDLKGVALNAALPVRVGFAACADEAVNWKHTALLPVADAPSGVLCRYAERGALIWQAQAKDTCQSANMPCGEHCETSTTTCNAGLSCVAVDGANDQRCLPNCSSDNDCTAGLTTCRDGLCRIANSW
jgi:hypothetical protein